MLKIKDNVDLKEFYDKEMGVINSDVDKKSRQKKIN